MGLNGINGSIHRLGEQHPLSTFFRHSSFFLQKTASDDLGAGQFPLAADTVRFSARKPAQPTAQKDDDKMITAKIRLPQGFYRRLKAAAEQRQVTIAEYLQRALPYLTMEAPKKDIVNQVSDTIVGVHKGRKVKTHVKTLLGPEQIFDSWINLLEKTEKYAQISMYNFENEAIKGGRGVDGADMSPGWRKQQHILKLIEEKASKGVRFQFILDNSVVRERDSQGNPIFPRRHTNDTMIAYLRQLKEEKGLPIDVVEYPRRIAHIYHVKMLISDGKRAIVGGMNLSNHSAANWDACVELQGPEVANLQKETFGPDWMLARRYKEPHLTLKEIAKELPVSEAVSKPGMKILNTYPREYSLVNLEGKEEIGDFLKAKVNAPDLKQIHSEQFIATHKEIKESLIQRHNEGATIKLLHSSSVVDQFPYSRKTVYDLIKHGVPVRYYNEWQAIGQKLHSKWTVFNQDEVLIGSANLSARGLETNVRKGLRDDYPNYPNQRYTRGNRDMAIVIKSPKIASTFLKQFNSDWEFSPPQHPAGYGQFEKADTPKWKEWLNKFIGAQA